MNKVAFVFPGQGSQYVGMFKVLFDKFSIARGVFEEANDVLGFNLQKLCFEGDLDELTKTENAQPALLTASVAAFRVCMEELGIVPQYSAGHSLGEISALTCSGAINFSDALKIARKRGMFMKEADSIGIGEMSAIIGIDREVIENQCKEISNETEILVVSNYNSPEQTVISGSTSAIEIAEERLEKMGATISRLKVSAAFHSPMMEPAAKQLKEELQKYSYNDLRWPVISNVTALPYENSREIVNNLAIQIVHPVRWHESMKYIENRGVDTVIELGPKTVLKKLVSRNFKDIKVFSFDLENDRKILKDMIKEEEPNYIEFICKCIVEAICTKNNNLCNEEYYKGFVEPYREIQKMKQQLEEEKQQPTIDEMRKALQMVLSAFDTKKTPINEQIERLNYIFQKTKYKNILPHFKDITNELI